MTLSLFFALTLQSATLPHAIPMPPPQLDEAAVLAPVERMFAGLKARDGGAIAKEGRADGQATVVVEKADGSKLVKTLTLADFASGIKPGPEAFEEKFVGRPSLEVDGDIAMVWAPYVFTLNGKFEHCGTNHFGLIREDGIWKIASIHWTQRKMGCSTI